MNDTFNHPNRPNFDASEKKTGRKNSELLSLVGILLTAPLIAVLLTLFVFQSYEVDGPSMEETLDDNDRLIVSKVGKTISSLQGDNYIPERYEIVIFDKVGSFDSGDSQQKQLIKRVVGLPGDRIVINDGEVTVFNDEHPRGLKVDQVGPQSGTVGFTDGNIDQMIDEGEIFVLGDNRANSLDSRSFGVIKSEDITGTLAARFYPFDQIESF